jgi:nucleoside-diphosphate-sugar epimerase
MILVTGSTGVIGSAAFTRDYAAAFRRPADQV